MIRPSTLPVLSRQETGPVITPMVPLNFVYPGLSLSQIFAIIWGYRKITLIIMTLVLAIAIVAIKFWPRTYVAEVTLMVHYEVNDPLNGKELPINQVGSYIATQKELIQNPELLGAVVDQLNLASNKEFAQGYNGKNGSLKQWIVEKLAKNLTVNQGQYGSQLLYVAFSANDPYVAAKIANTIADIYKKQDDDRSTSQPIERTARYAQQLDELKKNVELAQQQVSAFHKRHNLIDEGNRANFDVVMLSTLEGRLFEAQNQRRMAEARVAGDQTVSDAALASPEVQALKAKLADQRLRLVKLESLYTPQHPDLLDLQAAIEVTKQSLTAALQKYSANELGKLSEAKQLEKSLQLAVAKQRSKVLATSNLHDEAAKYLLALDSAQAVYKRALDGYDQLKFASNSHSSNVSFVSRASPPLSASKSKAIKALLMGAVVALILGLGLPMGYELFNRRVRCRDDIERDYGIPVLAELGTLAMRANP